MPRLTLLVLYGTRGRGVAGHPPPGGWAWDREDLSPYPLSFHCSRWLVWGRGRRSSARLPAIRTVRVKLLDIGEGRNKDTYRRVNASHDSL
jgi:hypothetical protein